MYIYISERKIWLVRTQAMAEKIKYYKVGFAIIFLILFNTNAMTQVNTNPFSNGIQTTIYKVDDLKMAKSWYSELLGFGPYYDQPYYVGFQVHGYELGLLPDSAGSAQKTENVLSYWTVEDVAKAHAHMVENGAIPFEPPTEVGEQVIVATVKDPWGNVIGLISNPHFAVEPKINSATVEWAPFYMKSTDQEAFMAASDALEQGFLKKQEGFIKRYLLQKSDHEWVDLIFWASEALAKQAMDLAMQHPLALKYFEFMDMEKATGEMRHLKLFK